MGLRRAVVGDVTRTEGLVELTLHREDVVERHPDQPRAPRQHPRGRFQRRIACGVEPRDAHVEQDAFSDEKGHRQHDREK